VGRYTMGHTDDDSGLFKVLACFKAEVFVDKGPVELLEPFIGLIDCLRKDHKVGCSFVLERETGKPVLRSQEVREGLLVSRELDHQLVQRVLLVPGFH